MKPLITITFLLFTASIMFSRDAVIIGPASQDLAAQFKFDPLTMPQMPDGESIAGHLDQLFSVYGKPLFLKRDNGSNLKHMAVNEIIDKNCVLPLNSPAAYPQYNGAIEHTQGEYQNYLKKCSLKAQNFREFKMLVENATFKLNHKFRRKLKNMHSCKCFFKKRPRKFVKRKRKEVYESIADLALDIVEKSGNFLLGDAAWRVAVRKWLEINNLIFINENRKVLPNFS